MSHKKLVAPRKLAIGTPTTASTIRQALFCGCLGYRPTSGEAPVGLSSTGNASFCAIWTTMLVPALTLPLFTGPHGLPIGAQLIAARDDDRKLFEVARWVQRAYAY